MRKQFRLLAMFAIASAAVVVSSCSGENDEFYDGSQQNGVTRSIQKPNGTTTFTFDDFDSSMLAAPTSKGENYYSYLGATPQIMRINDSDYAFVSEINTVGGFTEFSSGGIVLSNWSYRSNIAGKTNDWWYSWENQCSVYNLAASDGSITNAGHSGANFGVAYGYVDAYNQAWMAKPEFYFNVARKFVGLWICNSSYTYGVIKYGNAFGATGVATPLKDMNGYFQAMLECYGANGELIATKTYMLADYRVGQTPVDPMTEWTYWAINVEGVQSVKLNFEGSDSSAYGLNTPAYLCIDDITVE